MKELIIINVIVTFASIPLTRWIFLHGLGGFVGPVFKILGVVFESLCSVGFVEFGFSFHQLVEELVKEGEDVVVLPFDLVFLVGEFILANLMK